MRRAGYTLIFHHTRSVNENTRYSTLATRRQAAENVQLVPNIIRIIQPLILVAQNGDELFCIDLGFIFSPECMAARCKSAPGRRAGFFTLRR